MIKKLFLCAALVGAVGLTSCVDDVETASVQAIRGAKAEQFKANADLQNAQAEAAIVLANAKKATEESAAAALQAQADYKKALAEKTNAEAAYKNALAAAKNAKTESDKAAAAVELEKQKAILAQNQQLLEKLKLEIEGKKNELKNQIAEYEAQIALSLYNTEKYKQKLDSLVSKKADYEYGKLARLVKEYNDQAEELLKLKKELFKTTKELALFEAGLEYKLGPTGNWYFDPITGEGFELWGWLTSAEVATLKLIQTQEENINTYKGEIAAIEAQIKELQTTDVKNAQVKLEELEAQEAFLAKDKDEASAALTAASNAVTSAWNKLDDSDYMDAIRDVQKVFRIYWDSDNSTQVFEGFIQNADGNELIPELTIKSDWHYTNMDPEVFKSNVYVTVTSGTGNDQKTESLPLFSPAVSETKTIKTTYTNENLQEEVVYVATYSVYNPDEYYTLNKDGFQGLVKVANDNVTALNNAVTKGNSNIEKANGNIKSLKDADAVVTSKANAVNEAAQKLQEAQNNLANATADADQAALQKAVDDATAAKTAADEALTKANEDLGKAVKAVDKDATAADYQTVLDAQQDIVDDNTAWVNEIINVTLPNAKAFATAMSNDFKALNDNLAATKTMVSDYNTAQENKANAQLKYYEKLTPYNINQAEIDACQTILTDDNGDRIDEIIANLMNGDSETNKGIAYYENEIKKCEKEKTRLEGLLAGNKITDEEVVKAYKAEIATLEAKIKVQEELVAAAKAALDAALAEDAPAEK